MSPTNDPIAPGPDDLRPFVRISTDLPFGTKTNTISDPIAAIAAQVIAICASAQGFTDGHVPVNTIRRAGITDTIIKEMVSEEFWHDENSDISNCSRCETPRHGFVYVHDYLRHQRSAAQVRELREKRQAAGAASAQKRWEKLRAKQAAERTKKAAEDVAEGKAPEIRPEVEMLCNGFANLIARNDSKKRRPSVGKAWYEDMRKMLDIDKFTVEELKEVIEWTQGHPKWHKWVKSPNKLREQLKPEKNDLLGLMRSDKSVGGQSRRNNRASDALDIAEQLDLEFGVGDGRKQIGQ